MKNMITINIILKFLLFSILPPFKYLILKIILNKNKGALRHFVLKTPLKQTIYHLEFSETPYNTNKFAIIKLIPFNKKQTYSII